MTTLELTTTEITATEISTEPIADDGSIDRIRLRGRLDTRGVDTVEPRFIAATVHADRHAVVDLGDVSFVAPMGLRMIIRAATRMAAAGYVLVLLTPQPLVDAYLRATDLYTLVPVAYSEHEAAVFLAD